jgi:hypothetical protein
MRSSFLAPVALAALVGLVALSVAPAALADPSPADVAQARELGGQAQAAFDGGNYAESERLWIAAQNLYPAPTLTLGLARTEAKLGKLVAATEAYNKIIREQGDRTGLSPAFKDALESAKKEVGPVSSRVANVIITIDGPSSPTVTLDGQPVSAAALGLKRPVDPGQHALHAEAPGYLPADTTFQVADAGLAETKLKLEKAPDAAPVAGATPPPTTSGGGDRGHADADTKHGGSTKTLAIVAFGVGGAGLILGGITGFLALGKHSDLSDKCPGGTCPSTAKDDVDSYHTMGTLSTVGFIVAGVGVAAGAILWFTAPKEGATAKGTQVRPYLGLGPGQARVGAQF